MKGEGGRDREREKRKKRCACQFRVWAIDLLYARGEKRGILTFFSPHLSLLSLLSSLLPVFFPSTLPFNSFFPLLAFCSSSLSFIQLFLPLPLTSPCLFSLYSSLHLAFSPSNIPLFQLFSLFPSLFTQPFLPLSLPSLEFPPFSSLTKTFLPEPCCLFSLFTFFLQYALLQRPPPTISSLLFLYALISRSNAGTRAVFHFSFLPRQRGRGFDSRPGRIYLLI
jgi:hypothetical protein